MGRAPDGGGGAALASAAMTESPLTRWARRAVTVPTALAAPWVLGGAAPLAGGAALLADLREGDGRLWRSRSYGMALAYACAEAGGLLASGALWAAAQADGGVEGGRAQGAHHELQRAWAAAILTAGRTLLDLRIEAEGLDDLGPGPLVVLGRHASLPDAFLPAALFSVGAGRRLRMVIKDDLAWVPCLDVVGHRLPNAFVDRAPSSAAQAREDLARVGRDLGPEDVAVIFPEGTYPTPAARARALDRLAERQPSHRERAEGLIHLLPPRPAGAFALMDAAPDADVAILGHVGLEQMTSMALLARSLPLPDPVRARLWRIPRREVPSRPAARLEWLWQEWEALDRWVDAALEARRAPGDDQPVPA